MDKFNFAELAAKKEDLCDELKLYLEDEEGRLPKLRSPLVYAIPYTPMMNAFYNQQFRVKREYALMKFKEGAWASYIFIHERPYRFEKLCEAIRLGLGRNHKALWPIVGSVWTDSENIHQNLHGWKKVWARGSLFRALAMDDEERAALAAMPDEFKVWRGVTHQDAVRGLSWTTNKDKAIWFAQRYAALERNEPHLVMGHIRKKSVYAYFTGRNESEIVAAAVRARSVIKLEKPKQAQMMA